jgi:D-tyrosyl-tRNA(Tyr) deacylase
MRVLLQRVARASVTVDGAPVAAIGRGLLLLVGIGAEDAPDEVERLAEKVANLRVFADDAGKMNLALADVGGEVLVVSQFTLYGDVRKGRRPSWTGAAEPGLAAERVEAFARAFETRGLRVGRGVFGAHMEVELLNDGPVTLFLDASETPGPLSSTGGAS